MNSTENEVEKLLQRYQDGERYFVELDIENGDLRGVNLSEATFENCFFAVDFREAILRNTKFINGNIKTCDFRKADLTNAHFEGVAVEATRFRDAIAAGMVFGNNYCYGQIVHQQDFEEYFRKQ